MSDHEGQGTAVERRSVELSNAAIDWLVRLGSGRASPQDRLAFLRWRRISPAHEAAAREAEMLLRDLGDTRQADAVRRDPHAGARLMPRAVSGPVLRRRVFIGGGIAASAAVAAIGIGAFGPMAAFYADYATRVGERRRVELADGSIVTLNTATALSVDFSDERRRIRLYGGEALFEVAKDPDRPFSVVSDQAEARALGTVFAVRRTDLCSDVVVSEGVVEVRLGASEAIRLVAGQRLGTGSNDSPLPMAVDAGQATAWQRGKLIFNRRPLQAVVAELERYRPGRIVIVGDRLKNLQITGVFDLDDPDRLLRTLQSATQARISQLPLLTVIR